MDTNTGSHRPWTFLTNHARVLSLIAKDPGIRLRDVAAACRLTERAVQTIVADLEAEGYLTHSREGRRNRYQVTPHTQLRHPAEAGRTVAALLQLLDGEPATTDHEPDQPPENPAERDS
ncbi:MULTISPECIES: helix-turn-helix transcriptional regulator [Kitasatospora]|uniref:helix-turn-helix transcriptional regulator n=1 Tax=Kitasatospora TaxID=2063 RepID=UPI000C70E8D8|nr:winged helix-turn-helix domain-containing protein [Kitasatospora sp. GP30]MDH6143495.1 DNA-binding MarR family transcriptional regulator [Kitasatospora sp. GP30]